MWKAPADAVSKTSYLTIIKIVAEHLTGKNNIQSGEII